ncbi:lactosylceramide 4-alpha-galactosyltransferase-like [Rhodamnia argentea]|uniref:Lactosylceramide 4-alpha-galactosyltransferase-like n=1 Tax=Rhodamnia argentea TaxID=178133 RepID=A0A8B8QXF4_9MYRT|nr:lactosylceramide 4-alpha-galactosyltransferase-like [Rhodamnia argentea]
MKLSKLSRKMLDHHRAAGRTKPFAFAVITLAAVSLIVYSETTMSDVSLHLLPFNKAAVDQQEARMPESVIHPLAVVRSLQLQSIHEEFGEADNKDDPEDHSSYPLVPPLNVTEEERIRWLRENLVNFVILKSDNTTRKFHSRVVRFLGQRCLSQFFMTWISPVSSFGSRELLGIESLFRAHPKGCLVIVSRTMDSRRGRKILKPVTDLGFKVLAATPDLPQLLRKTPAEAWFDDLRKGNKDPGEIPLAQNLSNLIRLAVLYRYGGVYLDTDFVILKDISSLRNCIGAQSVDLVSGNWSRLNNAAMVFDRRHPLLYKFIQEFALTFDGNKWGHNGPYLVSRVVERVKSKTGYRGRFSVMSPMAFYPVGWTHIGGLFKSPENRGDARWVEAKIAQLSRDTYGVHLWNKQSRGLRIEEGSVVARLISDNCVICRSIYSS